jgi:hypothetical protein
MPLTNKPLVWLKKLNSPNDYRIKVAVKSNYTFSAPTSLTTNPDDSSEKFLIINRSGSGSTNGEIVDFMVNNWDTDSFNQVIVQLKNGSTILGQQCVWVYDADTV